jgi:SMC interacting uncharacterized protein involved in chromosome segregation
MKATKYIKYLIAGAALVILLMTAACDSKLNPAIMASEIQEAVTSTKSYDAAVFKEIQRNIDLVTALKDKMANASNGEEPPTLEESIKDIERVTESYENLASRKDEIDQYFKNKVGTIKEMQGRVETEVLALNKRIAEYNGQLREMQIESTDADSVRARKKALTQAIEYVQMQINLWGKFYQLGAEITNEMDSVQQHVNNFIGMIESSSILFREGLNLLQLQKNINDALALFTVDIPTIQKLTTDMEKSWSTLDYLIESLTALTTKIEAQEQ